MKRLIALWGKIRAYAAHADPCVEAANWIALTVAWNQPFYPLYVYGIVGDRLGPVFLTFLSTPVFAAIPLVARRAPFLSRILLPVAGMANTAITAKAFGVASGVEMFLLPCALIAAALFRPAERLAGLSLVAAALLLYLGLHDRYGPPLGVYDAAELAAMARINALSAAALTVFVGLLLSGLTGAPARPAARRESPRSRKGP
jgi:hypothetical protein